MKSLTTICICMFTISIHAQTNSKPPNKGKYKWEAGVNIGAIAIKGDITGTPGFNTGVWFGRSFTSWLSANIQFNHGTAKGLNVTPDITYSRNTAWADKYAGIVRANDGSLAAGYIRNGQLVAASQAEPVYTNYKTVVSEVAIYPKFSFWVPFSKPIVGFHLLTGVSLVKYKVMVDALRGNGETYSTLFSSIAPTASKAEIKSLLKAGMDGVYETDAQAPASTTSANFFVGIGCSVKMKTRFTLGFEARFINISTDLLDGQQWQQQSLGDPVLSRSYDRLASINVTLGYKL